MIVYNCRRRWFSMRHDADAYRVAEGLRPSALLKVEVLHRDDLVALLEALCSPPMPGEKIPPPATEPLVERAYVKPGVDIPDCVPDFLLRSHGIERKPK